ncbi:MAG: type II toxin-antitoxin system Phd/YefM family antitoxin [Treponema sp.]|jgi:PHD/YefM family antitoxin component YafN of YafNO toxin-antitoxin module|nr:type II toxin-antitoxin system Phd/YefM family antitoxin [Treponema sp.]
MVNPIIKPSSELRKNYNNIANICRTGKVPVFLTWNGQGDTVLMDIETYSRREQELEQMERLLAAEQDRMAGIKGHSVDTFAKNMKKAIEEGKKRAKQPAAK